MNAAAMLALVMAVLYYKDRFVIHIVDSCDRVGTHLGLQISNFLAVIFNPLVQSSDFAVRILECCFQSVGVSFKFGFLESGCLL